MAELSPWNNKAATLCKLTEPLGFRSIVVELGCIRYSDEVASDGWSTVYLASRAEERGWEFHSIDIDPQALQMATAMLLKNGLTEASLHHADATEWLLGFSGVIDCLYMDGPDDPNANLSQLIAAYDRLRYLVIVDDTQEYGGNRWGKGSMTLPFLEGKGWVVRHYLTVPGYRMSCAMRMPTVSMPDSAPSHRQMHRTDLSHSGPGKRAFETIRCLY